MHTLFITGTHEIQDLSVTVYTHQVCVGCVFTDWAKTNSCQVTIYSEITQTIKLITISSTTTALMNCTGDIPPGYYHILAYGTDNRTNPAVKKYHYINTTLPQGTLYANSKHFDFYFYFLIHVVEPQLILTSTTKATETMCVYYQTSMITNTTPVDIASKSLYHTLAGKAEHKHNVSFSIATSDSIQLIGFMAGIATLAAVALLAVTLSLAMFVYIRCRRQQSGLYST